MKYLFLLITVYSLYSTTDLLIFSFDRPLQLYALLESLEKRFKGINQTTVLYRSSDSNFEKAYNDIMSHFPTVLFKNHEGKEDFKEKVESIIYSSISNYFFFAVDDIIVTDECDIAECTHALKNTNSYAFYLRLGTNITHCYTIDVDKKHPLGIYTGTPSFNPINNNILSFTFGDKEGEWNYPHTVDMTIYPKAVLLYYLNLNKNWVHPNSFEGIWSTIEPLNTQGLCFNHSKIVNIPYNVVNVDWNSRNMNYTKYDFLTLFNQGYRIDIDCIYKLLPPAPHYEYPLTLFSGVSGL